MKKITFAIASLLTLSLAACSGNDKEQASTQDKAKTDAKADAKTSLINIRYIDEDTVSAHYNFAKDLKEQSIRSFSRLESAKNAKEKEIQTLGQQIQQKMQSNGYLTEDSYKADMTKLSRMQESAQAYLGNLQHNIEQEMIQQQQTLNDSLQSFIKDYNKTRGYDAILYKSAGVYYNPALDITKEVIEGLNARYNKVVKK